MKARDAGRLRAWLADSADSEADPHTVRSLRERLAAGGEDTLRIDAEPHGTLVVRERARVPGSWRRVLELDRQGHVLATLRWNDDGRLGQAWIKIADDSWAMIEPRAAYEPRWGLCDRLWHAVRPSAAAHAPLTLMESLAHDAIDRIPVVLEPARLPVGVGAALLNLLAALAADAGRAHLPYRGPYPTEQLFLALLESFRYLTTEPDPLAAFMAGRLSWSLAPHERACPAPGVTVHVRLRVEKVVWRERVYYRPDWQGVHRHAPRRVRDAGDAVICSLWALGEPVEDHLRIDREGTRIEFIAPAPHAREPRPLPGAVRAGVASIAAALGAAPLAPHVREMAERCEFRWAALDGDLAAVERTRISVSYIFRETLARKLRSATGRPERLAMALAALTELAHLIADPLRSRAQSHLATLPEAEQEHVLAQTEQPATHADDAPRIARAVESLIADTVEP